MICRTETAYYILGSQSPFRLQFAKLLEEAKYHYKYFGDNQTDKQSVMTHFKLCSNSQEIQTQNSELGVFSTFCSYYRCSQGSKNHSFPNKLVNNTGVCSISFHFVSSFSKSLEETVLVRHPLNSCDGTLSAELYVFQINNYVSFPLPQQKMQVVYKAFLDMTPNLFLEPGDRYYIRYAMILSILSTSFPRAPIMPSVSLLS